MRIVSREGVWRINMELIVPLLYVDNVLFFGCRHKDKDYHYKEQWDQYRNDGKLKVFTAFSRDQVRRKEQ